MDKSSHVALHTLPVAYDERMVVQVESFSPSAAKPRAVVAEWMATGIPISVITPTPVKRDQFALAHDPEYVDGILGARIRNGFGNTSPELAASLPWTSGAMLSAARTAIENRRVAIAPCSGFHHAGYRAGGGFCTFNGLMVVAHVLLKEGLAKRVGILDCDQHYGDGTNEIIKELNLGSLVVHYTAGEKWNSASQAATFFRLLPAIVEGFKNCDVLLYQAGADPHVEDPLGGWLTTDQLAERDRIVFQVSSTVGLPIAWNLAGGYQTPLAKVLAIHTHTLRACARVYLQGLDSQVIESAKKRKAPVFEDRQSIRI